MPRNHCVFSKYYIFSAKAAFQRNLSRKSSLKSLNEMDNSVFNLARKRASWRGKCLLSAGRFCYNEIQHFHLGIAQWSVLIRLGHIHWSMGEIESYDSYISPSATTDLPALMAEETPWTIARWFSAGKMAFQFQIFIGGKIWSLSCHRWRAPSNWMQIVFPGFYKHGVFKGVVALSFVENDKQIPMHHTAIRE